MDPIDTFRLYAEGRCSAYDLFRSAQLMFAQLGRDGLLEHWREAAERTPPTILQTPEEAASFFYATPMHKSIMFARHGLIPRRQG